MLKYTTIKSDEEMKFSYVGGRVLCSLSNNTYIGLRESDHVYVYVVDGILVREGFGEDKELLSKFADDKNAILNRSVIVKSYLSKFSI